MMALVRCAASKIALALMASHSPAMDGDLYSQPLIWVYRVATRLASGNTMGLDLSTYALLSCPGKLNG